ncbi:putative NAC domain-containing protein [Hibiscus syriacus]|uniref:NAC domain-containing protein n=1 Tax=Hibiscus syriacus TaxID=106335 RepID=A0A6A2ZBU6_HIBSY|nr:basic 30 kDa endochitinase-like [Hibiscus syriacus]KAE8689056.1 putative NAC domain-containing protein [Hibiscus syriacus]
MRFLVMMIVVMSASALRASAEVGSLISQDMFIDMLNHHNDANFPRNGFYTYDAFVAAANSFGAFGTTGDVDTQKREIAAFLDQISHETTGGWPTAPDGPYSCGYCYVQEQGNPGDYCVQNQQWPCVPGKKYFGRGPIQISHNYNYGPAGKAIKADLLNDPDLVAKDPTIPFKTGLWFLMTPQSSKPLCHDVITRQWKPSADDTAANRVRDSGCTHYMTPHVDLFKVLEKSTSQGGK